MIAGIIAVTNRGGYAGASVSATAAEAGVSKPTFYEYFADRDACFVAAIADVQSRLLGLVRAHVEGRASNEALQASLQALVEFATTEPAMARFLTAEPMGAGVLALDARDQGLAAIERTIRTSTRSASSRDTAPDFSSRMLIGGVYRLLAARLRRSEPNLTGLLPDLLAWVSTYERPLASHRWRALKAARAPAPSRFVGMEPLHGPERRAGGTRGLRAQEAAEYQRRRLMFAAAELAEIKGYTATTIGDITKRAGVDSRVFYSMFTDKQDAFMAVHELGFQSVMEVTAKAFFSGTTWPERNWEAGRAFTQFLERNPLVTNVGFVDAYAVGPGAIQRVEDSHTAFTMLLQEGYQHAAPDAQPPRLVLEAIVTTVFELVYTRARAPGRTRLSGFLPHLTFLTLAPFLGAEAANAYIDEKLKRAT